MNRVSWPQKHSKNWISLAVFLTHSSIYLGLWITSRSSHNVKVVGYLILYEIRRDLVYFPEKRDRITDNYYTIQCWPKSFHKFLITIDALLVCLYTATLKSSPRESWILDSTLWITHPRYWILVFVSGTWILNPIVSGIPDFLNCNPDSKAQDFGFQKQILLADSGFHRQTFSVFQNPAPLTWRDPGDHSRKRTALVRRKGEGVSLL